MAAERIVVEVACGEANRQTVVRLALPAGCTAREALTQSGILALHPAIDAGDCSLGVFGREVTHDHALADGDRLEVLRPLAEDPKERRRRLARTGRSMRAPSAGD